MAKLLKTDELYDLIAYNVGKNCSTKRVEKVLDAFKLILIDELQNKGEFKLEGVGKFSTRDYGGKDIIFGAFIDGVTEKRYIEKKKLIDFKSTPLFEDIINGKVASKSGKRTLKQNPRTKHSSRVVNRDLKARRSMDDILSSKIEKKEMKAEVRDEE